MRHAPVIPDTAQQLYVVRAGQGVPPPPWQLQLPQTPQVPVGWWHQQQGRIGGADAGAVGGRGGGRRSRGRPPIKQEGAGGRTDGDGTGAESVWVLMGWRCGVVRFVRLSVE